MIDNNEALDTGFLYAFFSLTHIRIRGNGQRPALHQISSPQRHQIRFIEQATAQITIGDYTFEMICRADKGKTQTPFVMVVTITSCILSSADT